jgi:hypothetical protein
VVCSDPALDPEPVVLVNFTSFEPEEESSCIVNAGEHVFVAHKSCMRYKDARVASVSAMKVLVKLGQAKPGTADSDQLLARIRCGASESVHLPEGCRQILKHQSLI